MSSEHIPRKRFGQNFLQNSAIIDKIVASIHPQADDLMLEIGPGQGALSEPLLAHLNALHALELDKDLVPLLQAKLAAKGLKLQQGDALQFDIKSLSQGQQKLRVVGNLPYNISTPLLFHLFDYRTLIDDMHFMLQLEVVERLCAKPGNKSYGRLSVMAQYYCQTEQLFLVPPDAFYPPPKVMSAIVRLIPHPHLAFDDSALFEILVKYSFSQRRKTLKNNLKQWLNAEQLEQLPIDLSLRPEQLSLADYLQLAQAIQTFQHD